MRRKKRHGTTTRNEKDDGGDEEEAVDEFEEESEEESEEEEEEEEEGWKLKDEEESDEERMTEGGGGEIGCWTRPVEIFDVAPGGEVTVGVAGGAVMPSDVPVAEVRLTVISAEGFADQEVSWLVSRVSIAPLPYAVGEYGNSATAADVASSVIDGGDGLSLIHI